MFNYKCRYAFPAVDRILTMTIHYLNDHTRKDESKSDRGKQILVLRLQHRNALVILLKLTVPGN